MNFSFWKLLMKGHWEFNKIKLWCFSQKTTGNYYHKIIINKTFQHTDDQQWIWTKSKRTGFSSCGPCNWSDSTIDSVPVELKKIWTFLVYFLISCDWLRINLHLLLLSTVWLFVLIVSLPAVLQLLKVSNGQSHNYAYHKLHSASNVQNFNDCKTSSIQNFYGS